MALHQLAPDPLKQSGVQFTVERQGDVGAIGVGGVAVKHARQQAALQAAQGVDRLDLSRAAQPPGDAV